MKHLLYSLILLSLFSCKQSETERRADYKKKALESDSYKDAVMNLKRVKDVLDSVKERKWDSKIAVFVYNNSIADQQHQVQTIEEVEKGMKNDTAYLKATLLRITNQMAAADSANSR
jgi:hypothetical protein